MLSRFIMELFCCTICFYYLLLHINNLNSTLYTMMIRFCLIPLFLILAIFDSSAGIPHWISADNAETDKPNTWIAFQKDITLSEIPETLVLDIAADSKYWLWINGKEVIFEGSLKRGPSPKSSYYDKVDVAPFLRKGANRIAILLWHFGKEGFSHKNSGRSGLIVRSELINSDASWVSRIYDAYCSMGEPLPNFRLAESSILFDARKQMDGWQTEDCSERFGFKPSAEIGQWGDSPWGELVERPIPQWKDFGIKELSFERKHGTNGIDTIAAKLPYNMQMTPSFEAKDNVGGNRIVIQTDHFKLNEYCLNAGYITRKGEQSYESLGWLSGENLYLFLPSDVEIKALRYRETGYDGEVAGRFSCSDDFYNRFWDKGMRTLYVNMRDTWFDCPERERAQWWGDVTVMMGEAFYSYSLSVHKLLEKAIRELCDWQKDDGTLFSPIPAGNYDEELPAQMLAAIGKYGFWLYYMNTGDRNIIEYVYPSVKKYLALYSSDETGLTAEHPGGWTWGDWGDNRDIRLLYAAWHYIALDAAADMADLLGYSSDAEVYRASMDDVKRGFDSCWDGSAYRHTAYTGETDDRVQALAVLSGIAGPEKYDSIASIFETNRHASPYMEKYVMEALFKMGKGEQALRRTGERYADMVNHPEHTTLFEGWVIDGKVNMGGTVNHAWSGGPITVLGQYLCGVSPVEPGYRLFKVDPQPAGINEAAIDIPTVAGIISSAYKVSDNRFSLDVKVPDGSEALVYLPTDNLNNISSKNIKPENALVSDPEHTDPGKTCLRLAAGSYHFTVSKISQGLARISH